MVELVALLPVTHSAVAPDAPKLLTSPGHTWGSPRAVVQEALDTSKANGSMSTVQSFGDTFKWLLEQPVIGSLSRLHITKDPKYANDDDFIPKRSARFAAKSNQSQMPRQGRCS
jgi:hypothetical protein